MMRIRLAALSAVAGLSFASAASAAVTVVTNADIGPGPNPAAASWHYSVANPTGGSSAAVVNGIATPPLGTGSYHSIMSGGDNYVSLDSGNIYESRKLSDLENITFSFYNNDPGSIYNEEMVTILRVDENGNLGDSNTVLNGRVWLQPNLNGGVRPDNQWHTVSFDRDDPVWEIVGLPGFGGTASLDDLYAQFPDAVLVGNTGVAGAANSYKSTFRIANGSGGTQNDAYYDALSFTWDNDQNPAVDSALVTDTYNFEVPEPGSLAFLAGAAALGMLRRRRA